MRKAVINHLSLFISDSPFFLKILLYVMCFSFWRNVSLSTGTLMLLSLHHATTSWFSLRALKQETSLTYNGHSVHPPEGKIKYYLHYITVSIAKLRRRKLSILHSFKDSAISRGKGKKVSYRTPKNDNCLHHRRILPLFYNGKSFIFLTSLFLFIFLYMVLNKPNVVWKPYQANPNHRQFSSHPLNLHRPFAAASEWVSPAFQSLICSSLESLAWDFMHLQKYV